MDNSPEYIKMCEKAVEIQKGWEPIGGDWIIHDYRGTTGLPLTVEQQVWGSDDTKWNRTEILCYRPSGSKDFFVSTDGNDSHVTSAKDLLKHHVVFLPRQDQLQEMVGSPAWDYKFSEFSNWLDIEPGLSIFNSVTSMEQLWLAFVMKEKFNKVWNGEDWVANEKNDK